MSCSEPKLKFWFFSIKSCWQVLIKNQKDNENVHHFGIWLGEEDLSDQIGQIECNVQCSFGTLVLIALAQSFKLETLAACCTIFLM